VRGRERVEGQDDGLRVLEHRRDLGQPPVEVRDRLGQVIARLGERVGVEDRADQGRKERVLVLARVAKTVPEEVHGAALPGAAEHLGDRRLQLGVRVRDGELHTDQAALDELPEEVGPERLDLGLADVEAHDFAPPGLVNAVRDHQRPVDHAAAAEAVELLRTTLPVAGAQVRLAGGAALATDGPTADAMRFPVGTGDELLVVLGRELTDEEMSIVRAVANTLATALARLRGEEQMRHEAVDDPLTGLANRTLLRDRLKHAQARALREGGDRGVLFVDLDNFKQVNDVHGHAAGDAVLVELGERLRHAVRPADTVARLGGDEFVVLCDEIDEAAALALARRLQHAIEQPLIAAGAEQSMSASIGLAVGARRREHVAGGSRRRPLPRQGPRRRADRDRPLTLTHVGASLDARVTHA
jgi:diguanylate cyclase (GGDEF)-like protein